MALVKFAARPFQSNLNNLFDDLLADVPGFFQNGSQGEQKGFAPVNIKEFEKNYSLEVVAPGFEKADFKINLDQDVLTISAEKKQEVKTEKDAAKQIRKEYAYRSFKRSFTLDEKINAAAIEAAYVNGVLTLNLPKKEEVKSASKDIIIQ